MACFCLHVTIDSFIPFVLDWYPLKKSPWNFQPPRPKKKLPFICRRKRIITLQPVGVFQLTNQPTSFRWFSYTEPKLILDIPNVLKKSDNLRWKQPGDPPVPNGCSVRLVRLNRTVARWRPAQCSSRPCRSNHVALESCSWSSWLGLSSRQFLSTPDSRE